MLKNNPKIVTNDIVVCGDAKEGYVAGGGGLVPGGSTQSAAKQVAALNTQAYTTYTSGNVKYYVWTFTSSGTFNVGSYNPTVDVLVVAGGGGAGHGSSTGAPSERGGGGGAGGYRYFTGLVVGGSNAITVGGGGNAGSGGGTSSPSNGGNSSAFGKSATGGGCGAYNAEYYDPTTDGNPYSGADGGSGGGAHRGDAPIATNPGGAGNAGGYTPVEGYAGGSPTSGVTYSGGGGGAGAAGTDNALTGGGGAGVANSITGSSVTYAVGGDVSGGAAGTANRGNGGSGAVEVGGGSGGSGVVIIRIAEVSEPCLFDATGNGNNGTMYTGTCLDFDETDDYIASASGVTWGVADKWTVSWWMYMDSTALQTFFSLQRPSPATDKSKIEFITNNGIREIFGVFSDGDGDSVQVDTNNGVWNTGEWTHVAVTNNGSTTIADAFEFYINGVQVNNNVVSAPYGPSQAVWTDDARTLNIGQQVGTGRNVDGRMADVRMYSVALSASNVKEIYDDSKVIIPTKNDASGGFVSQTDLKLWLPLMEGAGVVAYDGSGNGNHCDVINDPNWIISDQGCPQLITGYNRPMLFDGSSDYVSIADSATLSVGSTFTISYWFYPEDITTESYHIAKNTYTGNQKSYAVIQYSTGKTQFRVSGDGSSHIECTGDTVMSNKAWHHIVHVFDGGAGTKLKGWVDGTAQSFNQQPNVTAAYDSTSILCLGTRDAGLVAPFAGIINEVIIYNSALDATDAAALYATGPNGGPLPPDPRTMSYSSSTTSANIMGYWRNDNNVTLTDLSGNSNTGTAIGSPDVLLFKQGYNGSASTSTGRDGQGFPLLYQNNGAVGFTQLSGSKVTIPHSSDILWDINANFTIITWYKIDSNPSGTYPSIWGKGGQHVSGPGYELFLNPAGTSFTLRGTWAGGPTWGMNAAYGSAGNPMDGSWHCVTVAIDRDNPTTGGKLYQDNAIQSQVNISGLGDTTNTVDLTLASAGAGLFHGQIAGVQIYNRVLTDDELTQNFNAQRSRFGV